MVSIAVLALVAVMRPSHAVPARAKAYFQAAAVLSLQGSGPINHRVDPPLSGISPGLTVSAGGFVARRVALEGELNLNGDLSAPQTFSYFSRDDYIVHNRDIALGASVRLAGRHLDVVGGGGWGFTRTQNTDVVNTRNVGPEIVRTPEPDVSSSYRGWSLNGGVDVPLSSGRTQVLATTRLRWTQRPLADLDYVGVSAFALQFSVAVRINSSTKAPVAAQRSRARPR
jgi:hypothetical protein